jgi:hypothetical protein
VVEKKAGSRPAMQEQKLKTEIEKAETNLLSTLL